VGKSTLVNRLVGQKVAIVTEKPQTTRNRIMGVVNGAGFQLVLLDTPGIHKPRHFLGRAMVKTAKRALHEVELIVFMVDGEYRPGGGDRYISRQLAGLETPVIMAVNKLDEVAPDQLQSRLEAYSELLDVEEQLAISALRGDNVPRLLQLLVDRLPEGPRYFPEDMVTDRPESFILAELVREQVLKLTREEVPHSVGVVVEELAERDNNMLYVNATILVERSSQKGILIGRGGRMLKDIGKRARNEIEALLGTRCYLDLWVKVSKDWRNREREVQRLGYGEQS
jgi:GTP-binding protein Era